MSGNLRVSFRFGMLAVTIPDFNILVKYLLFFSPTYEVLTEVFNIANATLMPILNISLSLSELKILSYFFFAFI